MENVYARADEYQSLHTRNKSKREELTQIERRNTEIQQSLVAARGQLEDGNERLRVIRKETAQLGDRKQASERCMIRLTETESRVNELRKDNKASLRQIDDFEKVLRNSKKVLEKKRSVIGRVISEIENRQNEIDEVWLKYGRSCLIVDNHGESDNVFTEEEELNLVEKVDSQIHEWLEMDV
jgi:predicted  nucleic acid-binding Zn-ribbon protein